MFFLIWFSMKISISKYRIGVPDGVLPSPFSLQILNTTQRPFPDGSDGGGPHGFFGSFLYSFGELRTKMGGPQNVLVQRHPYFPFLIE